MSCHRELSLVGLAGRNGLGNGEDSLEKVCEKENMCSYIFQYYWLFLESLLKGSQKKTKNNNNKRLNHVPN